MIPYIDLSKETFPDVLKMVSLAEENDTNVLVRDLSGIRDNAPLDDEIRELCDHGSVWVMAGSRTEGTAMDMLILGADIVFLQTSLLPRLGTLERLLELTSNVGLVAETENGEIANLSGRIDLGILAESLPRLVGNGLEKILVWPLDDHPPERVIGALKDAGVVHMVKDDGTLVHYKEWRASLERK